MRSQPHHKAIEVEKLHQKLNVARAEIRGPVHLPAHDPDPDPNLDPVRSLLLGRDLQSEQGRRFGKDHQFERDLQDQHRNQQQSPKRRKMIQKIYCEPGQEELTFHRPNCDSCNNKSQTSRVSNISA